MFDQIGLNLENTLQNLIKFYDGRLGWTLLLSLAFLITNFLKTILTIN